MREEMRAGQEYLKERMMAKMDSQLKKMESCLEKTEAVDLEGTEP
jgi:hypothetical protein